MGFIMVIITIKHQDLNENLLQIFHNYYFKYSISYNKLLYQIVVIVAALGAAVGISLADITTACYFKK